MIPDIRQSKEWGEYMQGIGWKVKRVGNTQLFIKPIFNFSFIKIQHPANLPFGQIDKLAKKYHTLSVVIEPTKEFYFQKHGYQPSKLHFAHSKTQVIDITQPEKKIFYSFSENAKRNIRKAEISGLKTVVVQKITEADKSTFLILLKKLSRLKKFLTLSDEEFQIKINAFQKNSIFLFAYDKEEPVASVWLSCYKGSLVYMQTGITKVGYQKLANYLLVWEGIKLGKKLGLKRLDFDAMYDPRFPKLHKSWKNFSEFKKRFHGQSIEFPQPQIKFYNPIFKLVYIIGSLWS